MIAILPPYVILTWYICPTFKSFHFRPSELLCRKKSLVFNCTSLFSRTFFEFLLLHCCQENTEALVYWSIPDSIFCDNHISSSQAFLLLHGHLTNCLPQPKKHLYNSNNQSAIVIKHHMKIVSALTVWFSLI